MRITDAFEVVCQTLHYNNQLDLSDYFNSKLKHIKSLVFNGVMLDGIHRTNDLLNLIKEKKNRTIHNIHQVRSLLGFMAQHCLQKNYYKFASNFRYKKKLLDLTLLKSFELPSHYDDELHTNPGMSRFGNPSNYILVGSNLQFYKGKKLKQWQFIIKIISKIFGNIFSRFFWGYGEKISRLIISSLFCVIFFTVLVNIGVIEVLQDGEIVTGFINQLYFSIVTFTSLGYGDIQPASYELSRILMAIEALLGLLFISLIVYLIGKKSMH